MRIIILGAPGAGKGTQASMLTEKLNIPHISTGDIFRSNIKNGTLLGRKAKEYMDRGALVPDDVTIGIVQDRLKAEDCRNGFLLDGFPRTIPQAEALDRAIAEMGRKLDKVLNIHVDDEKIIERLSGRRVCPSCGTSFHTVNKTSCKEGICDVCGAGIIQRDDDKEETVRNRLKVYHNQTEPLIEYYRKKGILAIAEGHGKIEDTSREVLKALGI